jgi:hypothetical protein
VILGFSHVTFGTGQFDRATEFFQKKGFVLKDAYRSVLSPPAKWPLMARRPRRHDLALLMGSLTVEIVSHETGSVDGPTVIDVDPLSGLITLNSGDVARECEFFVRSLPCAKENGRIEICGAFPKWSAQLRLVENRSATYCQPLDIEGYSCLAFYSNNICEDVQRLVSLGAGSATEEFAVNLNGRRVSVAMMRSPGGAIIELLKVDRL